MKRILLFGGTGFIGLNILDYCTFNKNDIQLCILYRENIPEEYKSNKNFTFIQVYKFNFENLEEIFKSYQFDEIFHFISTSNPSKSNENIYTDLQSNLILSINILELMNIYRVKKITYLSSGGAVYSNYRNYEFQEENTLTPNNSYGIIKLTIEKYIILFHKMYQIDYLILRISNLYGEYHKSIDNGFINIAIRKALIDEKIQIWGNGEIKKDYLYIKDFLKIFWILNQKNIKNKIINVGSGNMYSINELINYLKINLPNLKVEYMAEKMFDTKITKFDISLLSNLVSLNHTEFNDSLKSTISWELNNL
jgi:UDP-glucose 4-epimerase